MKSLYQEEMFASKFNKLHWWIHRNVSIDWSLSLIQALVLQNSSVQITPLKSFSSQWNIIFYQCRPCPPSLMLKTFHFLYLSHHWLRIKTCCGVKMSLPPQQRPPECFPGMWRLDYQTPPTPNSRHSPTVEATLRFSDICTCQSVGVQRVERGYKKRVEGINKAEWGFEKR